MRHMSFQLFQKVLLANCVFMPIMASADWVALDPQNILTIDSSKGRILVELRPDMAPQAVERVVQLSREGVYDGLQFHRVIAGFVAQTGNPNNKDGGASHYPDLPAEFVFRLPWKAVTSAGTGTDFTRGFLGSVPIEGTPLKSDQTAQEQAVRAWGAYCPGVVGMGRQEAKNSANSELFFMLAPARRLDRDYTVIGRVLGTNAVLQQLAVGEPPSQPDTMVKVRLLAELPPDQRPRVFGPTRTALQQSIQQARTAKGADFSICDVNVPSRIEVQTASTEPPPKTR